MMSKMKIFALQTTLAKLRNEPNQPVATLDLTLATQQGPRTSGRVEQLNDGSYVGSISLNYKASQDIRYYGLNGIVKFYWTADNIVTSVTVETP